MVTVLIWVLMPIYVVCCFFLIAVVLLQQGKGADLAGAFGGMGSQTAFGARGATTLLQRLTTWAFGFFIIISMTLTVAEAKRTNMEKSVLEGAAATEEAGGTGEESPASEETAPPQVPAEESPAAPAEVPPAPPAGEESPAPEGDSPPTN